MGRSRFSFTPEPTHRSYFMKTTVLRSTIAKENGWELKWPGTTYPRNSPCNSHTAPKCYSPHRDPSQCISLMPRGAPRLKGRESKSRFRVGSNVQLRCSLWSRRHKIKTPAAKRLAINQTIPELKEPVRFTR